MLPRKIEVTSTIAVDLIHPTRKEAVQTWTFDASQRIIHIGRSRGNEISLLSGVVSRKHAVLKFDGKYWILESLGTNGCYLDDRLVKNIALGNGAIFRIARTGPRLRVRIESFQAAAPLPPLPRSIRPEARQAPRSRLSQEEITTARETWVAPTGMTFRELQRQSARPPSR